MTKDTQHLQEDIKLIKNKLDSQQDYMASKVTLSNWIVDHPNEIPLHGSSAVSVRNVIEHNHSLDFQPQLNTSSYVNVSFEPEEKEIALMGLKVNLADQTVYPQSYKIHDMVVNMIAKLWHCPEPDDMDEYGVYPGAGTVGSTEACLLAGLALKFRWRKWYAEKNNLTSEQVLAKRPNIIISTCYQAAWEKLFKYMDISCKLITPKVGTFTIDPEKLYDLVDDHTIAVVCIMGNHYGGQYDPVHEVDRVLTDINKKQGFQVGIHVDAASGGFIAPFQKNVKPWDFRLQNVMSISSSGHKYGESCCGTGWVVWRQRKDLSEHVAISVTYLGGKADSYTLNFSRPASGVYVQFYKLLRYGTTGYQECCDSMMQYAQYIRDGLKAMTYKGKPRFVLLDSGDDCCLPVVTAMLNPDCNLTYDDIDLQNALSQHHWYVSGYKMGFNHPLTEKMTPLFSDEPASKTMFRIVIKSNLSSSMMHHLLDSFKESLEFLDSVDFSKSHKVKSDKLRHKDQIVSNHC
jgi:glutamate decarboxylase